MAVRKILQVHELSAALRDLLERNFPDVWVEGEISGLSQPSSGHLYFSLKDAKARLKIVLFRAHRRFLRVLPKEGEAVLIRAHLSLYAPRGEIQLVCDYIEPKGAGALQAAFEVLKNRLKEEGLFELARKRAIPLVVRRLGLVTSQNGAALRDILKVMWKTRFQPSVLLAPVAVQGDGAAVQIAGAIDRLNAFGRTAPKPLDVLIVTRGGGSLEDLRAFNEEVVVRAIVRSRIPVISAIGHESDTLLSDYAADLRAPTPSVAAEIVVQNGLAAVEALRQHREGLVRQMRQRLAAAGQRIETAQRLLASPARQIGPLRSQVGHLSLRLKQAILRLVEARSARLAQVSEALRLKSPLQRLRACEQKLLPLYGRLLNAGRAGLDGQKSELEARMAQLDLLSPLNILGRGYSITRKIPGLSIVRRAEEVALGEPLQIVLHRGRLNCRVEEKTEASSPPPCSSGPGLP